MVLCNMPLNMIVIHRNECVTNVINNNNNNNNNSATDDLPSGYIKETKLKIVKSIQPWCVK